MRQSSTDDVIDLKRLDTLRISELRDVYDEIFKRPPPARAGADFIKGNVAWAIQTRKLNKDPAILREMLSKTASSSASSCKFQYKPGTRLIREWRGQTYEVTVLETGFLWQDQTYRGLTEIATRITGTKWSGPRFFGLKGGKP